MARFSDGCPSRSKRRIRKNVSHVELPIRDNPSLHFKRVHKTETPVLVRMEIGRRAFG